MRGNGTGEATVENTFTYDSLHRIVSAHEDYGNDNRSYSYDSLGNLTYETLQGNKSVDYKLNSLNQITSSSEDGWKTLTEFEYDKRGNLVKETYGKNKQLNTTAQYVYDESNKMVKGINAAGESSVYVYNGLGALVENVWTIAKNAYGYHDVDAGNYTPLGDISTGSETNNGHGNGNSSGNTVGNNGNGNVKNPSTVVKQFVVDYTSETYEPLTEHEINGLDYRYVYGNDRLSVNVTGVETSSGNIVENGNQIRLYYHMDYLGTADYLTSPVSLKVTSWTHYNEWGEITHNAVLKCGMRELDMVKRYATHDYDNVLNMFYAKARFYDADNRRFASVDPILEPSGYDIAAYVDEPVQLVQYLYVRNGPLTLIDPLGLVTMKDGTLAHVAIEAYIASLQATGAITGTVNTEVKIENYPLSKSGKGYADVVIENSGSGSKSDVYEIKTLNTYNNFHRRQLAHLQLESYVTAINNSSANAHLQSAQKGRAILKDLNGVTIPMPGDSKRYIKLTTFTGIRGIGEDGMIYYEILNCPKPNPKNEMTYYFSRNQERELQDEAKYKERISRVPDYVYSAKDYVYVKDSAGFGYEVESYDEWYFYEWLRAAEVRTFRESFGIGSCELCEPYFTSISFPDGTTLYRCDGLGILGPAKQEPISYIEKISVFYNKDSLLNITWYKDTTAAFRAKAVSEVLVGVASEALLGSSPLELSVFA